ncbi:efflux RND transporter periplasmic adaptor subunit [Acuticoccus sp. M5D2P5]|uniref:efflux RND transporter periplasmic adaptor subunit n=1 Tax=Acuticoccus kalidii TaxID=2910977 RepID=UPI001F3ED4AC|nr:efflux RND transporter periplasmic adaptor subunit [Acuticoccus kalidii]MCF3934907.1 efflux RND transporter periplasmic adaptor subunit [Acuticoccus kalidii]
MSRLQFLLLGAVAFGLAACEPEAQTAEAPPPPEVTVAKPVARKIVEDDEFVGRFAAVDEVEVRARVSGYLAEIHFTDGQIVKEGDLLFTIDQRPYAAEKERAEAQERVSSAELEYAKQQFDRGADLLKRGTIPQSQHDERIQAYLAAQAHAEASKAATRTASLDYDYTEIRAPIAGRIDRRFVSVGNLVQPDQTVLTRIVSLDPIDIYFDIDERSLLNYARDARVRGTDLQQGGGLDVKVRLADERDGAFTGKLDFAENRVDNASGTIRLRARLDNSDFIMQPGMFGRVNVPGSLPHDGIMLPDKAVASNQNQRIVYVVDEENTVSAKPVRPGPRIDGYRVIRSGLDGTETVVIEGLMRVRPGVKVTPKLTELPPTNEPTEG